MKLISPNQLHQIHWSNHPTALACQKIWLPVMQQGARHYIKNVDCEAKLLTDGQLFLPVVIPDPSYNNSYVCSPYSQYVDYGYREVDIELGEQFVAKSISKAAIKAFERCAPRPSFDKVVFVNNWLLSTNLYPDLSKAQLQAIIQLLTKKYPDRAIVFRSVSEVLNASLFQKMKGVGLEPVLSRQIYVVDTNKGAYKKKKAFKEDLRLQRNRRDYHWVRAEGADTAIWKRVKDFYDQLYLKKYSTINPQFTNAFFRDSIQHHWLRYYFLKKGDNIHACIGYLHRNGIMTTPIIGYDFELPQKEGLYRLLSLQIVQEGDRNKLLVHSSSGASTFKKVRGAEASLEYNFVYIKHLSRTRKFPWQTLQKMTQYIATPLLTRYEL